LEELIRRVLIQTTCDLAKTPAAPLVSSVHQEILSRIKAGDAILTFNYDTVIEEAFAKEALWTPRDGYGGSQRVYGVTHAWAKNWLKDRSLTRNKTSDVVLLKLHGSVNWKVDDNGFVRLKQRPYVVRRGSEERIGILPPGWNKQIDKNPYKVFWREARSRLENAQSLVIIGYSLPETDLLARALFSEVVRKIEGKNASQHLKELHIAEPLDQVAQKLIRLFTPALGPCGRVYKYRGGIDEFKKKLCT